MSEGFISQYQKSRNVPGLTNSGAHWHHHGAPPSFHSAGLSVPVHSPARHPHSSKIAALLPTRSSADGATLRRREDFPGSPQQTSFHPLPARTVSGQESEVTPVVLMPQFWGLPPLAREWVPDTVWVCEEGGRMDWLLGSFQQGPLHQLSTSFLSEIPFRW